MSDSQCLYHIFASNSSLDIVSRINFYCQCLYTEPGLTSATSLTALDVATLWPGGLMQLWSHRQKADQSQLSIFFKKNVSTIQSVAICFLFSKDIWLSRQRSETKGVPLWRELHQLHQRGVFRAAWKQSDQTRHEHVCKYAAGHYMVNTHTEPVGDTAAFHDLKVHCGSSRGDTHVQGSLCKGNNMSGRSQISFYSYGWWYIYIYIYNLILSWTTPELLLLWNHEIMFKQ